MLVKKKKVTDNNVTFRLLMFIGCCRGRKHKAFWIVHLKLIAFRMDETKMRAVNVVVAKSIRKT